MATASAPPSRVNPSRGTPEPTRPAAEDGDYTPQSFLPFKSPRAAQYLPLLEEKLHIDFEKMRIPVVTCMAVAGFIGAGAILDYPNKSTANVLSFERWLERADKRHQLRQHPADAGNAKKASAPTANAPTKDISMGMDITVPPVVLEQHLRALGFGATTAGNYVAQARGTQPGIGAGLVHAMRGDSRGDVTTALRALGDAIPHTRESLALTPRAQYVIPYNSTTMLFKRGPPGAPGVSELMTPNTKFGAPDPKPLPDDGRYRPRVDMAALVTQHGVRGSVAEALALQARAGMDCGDDEYVMLTVYEHDTSALDVYTREENYHLYLKSGVLMAALFGAVGAMAHRSALNSSNLMPTLLRVAATQSHKPLPGFFLRHLAPWTLMAVPPLVFIANHYRKQDTHPNRIDQNSEHTVQDGWAARSRYGNADDMTSPRVLDPSAPYWAHHEYVCVYTSFNRATPGQPYMHARPATLMLATEVAGAPAGGVRMVAHAAAEDGNNSSGNKSGGTTSPVFGGTSAPHPPADPNSSSGGRKYKTAHGTTTAAHHGAPAPQAGTPSGAGATAKPATPAAATPSSSAPATPPAKTTSPVFTPPPSTSSTPAPASTPTTPSPAAGVPPEYKRMKLNSTPDRHVEVPALAAPLMHTAYLLFIGVALLSFVTWRRSVGIHTKYVDRVRLLEEMAKKEERNFNMERAIEQLQRAGRW